MLHDIVLYKFNIDTEVDSFRSRPMFYCWCFLNIFLSQKHAKFGTILDDFKVQRQISPERKKIFQIKQVFDLPRFLPH